MCKDVNLKIISRNWKKEHDRFPSGGASKPPHANHLHYLPTIHTATESRHLARTPDRASSRLRFVRAPAHGTLHGKFVPTEKQWALRLARIESRFRTGNCFGRANQLGICAYELGANWKKMD